MKAFLRGERDVECESEDDYDGVENFHLATEIVEPHAEYLESNFDDEKREDADGYKVQDVWHCALSMKFQNFQIYQELCDHEESVKDDKAYDDNLELVRVENMRETFATHYRVRFSVVVFGRHRAVGVVFFYDSLCVVCRLHFFEALHSHLKRYFITNHVCNKL